MNEFLKDKKRLLMAGGAVLLVVIAVILVFSLRSHNRTVQYQNYRTSAETCVENGDYDKAVRYLERAYDVKDTDECAIALANAYVLAGQTDKAEELLWAQMERKGSDTAKLKQALASLGVEDEIPTKGVEIAGKLYDETASSLVITDTKLSKDDLDQLENFESLTALTLKNCGIDDLAFLKHCGSLTSLTLSDNGIEDLSSLKHLTDLRTLYLDNNPIEDFSPLYKLKHLTTLSIKKIDLTQSQYDELSKKLEDCKIFSDDTVAEELELGGVKFDTDVTELDLTNKHIRDISVLAKCTQLQSLNLKGNEVSDLSPLEHLENLTYLDIDGNE